VKHYVLTRSAFGPAWDKAANMRRLAVTRAVTARTLARQTLTDWTWIVLLDERDIYLNHRLDLYRDSAPTFVPLIWAPPEERRLGRDARAIQRIAAADYTAPWRSVIPTDDVAVMTRLDDDDGLAPAALARYAAAAEGVTAPTALMLPMGIRVWRGRYSVVRHEQNAMHALATPVGSSMIVYGYNHTKLRSYVPVKMLDDEPGWLWVRHIDTISGWRKAERPITAEVRALFPADWEALNRSWRSM
jgi:hypothetical protein